MIEKIVSNGKLIAIIIRHLYIEDIDDIKFVTEKENSLQLGILNHRKNYIIKPHIHCNSQKIINDVQEMLHVEYGKVQVDYYDNNGNRINSSILLIGDTILLISGGHGLRILEDTVIIEVKQGYYISTEEDKIHFEAKGD